MNWREAIFWLNLAVIPVGWAAVLCGVLGVTLCSARGQGIAAVEHRPPEATAATPVRKTVRHHFKHRRHVRSAKRVHRVPEHPAVQWATVVEVPKPPKPAPKLRQPSYPIGQSPTELVKWEHDIGLRWTAVPPARMVVPVVAPQPPLPVERQFTVAMIVIVGMGMSLILALVAMIVLSHRRQDTPIERPKPLPSIRSDRNVIWLTQRGQRRRVA